MSDEQTTSGCNCEEFAGVMRTSFQQALYNDMWLHFGQVRTPPYTGLVRTPAQCTGAIMNKDLQKCMNNSTVLVTKVRKILRKLNVELKKCFLLLLSYIQFVLGNIISEKVVQYLSQHFS